MAKNNNLQRFGMNLQSGGKFQRIPPATPYEEDFQPVEQSAPEKKKKNNNQTSAKNNNSTVNTDSSSKLGSGLSDEIFNRINRDIDNKTKVMLDRMDKQIQNTFDDINKKMEEIMKKF